MNKLAWWALAVWVGLASGCATYDEGYPRPVSTAIADHGTTTIGAFFAEDEAAHEGESGVAVLRYGRASLAARLAFVDAATRTLDLQYYIWDADISGRLLGERLVRAADRGVRVRVLLDDHTVVDRDNELARLAGHPQISIRAFNPYRHRSRTIDMLIEFGRINRRSHNKIFIADNAMAIVGGRNIADHYFGVDAASNYRDLDIAAVGPVVREVSAVFDDFWNSPYAVPYGAFVKEPATAEDAAERVATMRQAIAESPTPYPIDEDIDALRRAREDLRDQLIWGPASVLYDAPEKASDRSVRGIVDELATLSEAAEQEVLIENSYLVPTERMVKIVAGLVERGVSVQILTNSLSSNDVAVVHAGYRKRRDDLIRAGASVYELRPDATVRQRWSVLSSQSRAGLHTKAMVIDREHVLIGSFNLDPRSANINSECVMLVHSKELGEQVAAFLNEGVQTPNAYHVTLDGGKLRWTTVDADGEALVFTKEPQTSWWKRFVTGVMGLLPIESQI